MLFADVAGFTRMSSALDPEEVHSVMRRCFDQMLTEVHRYEGTVSQFLGDGMLALFGAPLSHEDHALRAVLAGLGIQESLARYRQEVEQTRGIDFRVRVGLNSGLVVVGSVGVDLTMDYLAVGDTVNLAARMQALAEPGAVVISENTYRLVQGQVVVRDLGAREVKGKDEPVNVYEVVRPSRGRTRVEVAAERGLAPFVGREHELAMLETRLEDARFGRGQMVMLRGDAGIGKSRLLYELRAARGQDVAWLTGRGVSYGSGIPYLPIVDLLKEALGVEESDSDDELEAKVALLDDEARPFLRLLLGLDPGDEVAKMDPLLRKARTLEVLRAELLRRAAARPHVLVVEDLHWADQASLEFISYLADSVPHSRILLVVTFRSGWEHPFGARSFLTQLDLGTLSDSASASLAASVLGHGSLPAELEEVVLAKTEGNPFFVEEVVRSLLESGALARTNGSYQLARPLEEITVPDTVEGVLMARLDRLEDEPKRALQTASVIGREFTVRLLERTAELERRSEETLRRLKAVELIYERSLYPELAYMFKHALTHDVAYRSLLLERRRELHCVVAAAIEELYADRLAEHVELIAFHAERGEQWRQAFDYLLRSGKKAFSAFAAVEAVDFFRRAEAITDRANPTDEELLALYGSLGAALEGTSDWAAAVDAWSGMLRVAERLGDRVQLATALYHRSFAQFWNHHFEESREDALAAHATGEQLAAAPLIAGSLLTISFIQGVTGEIDAAAESLATIRELLPQLDDGTSEAFVDYWDGLLNHWAGAEAVAVETLAAGAAHGRAAGAPIAVVANLWTQGMALTGAGRYEEAIATFEEALAICERLGERIYRCRLLNSLGWAYMDICNWASATLYNRQGYDEALTVGDPEIIRNAALNLADIALEQGAWNEAERLLREVEEGSRRTGVWGEEFMKWRYTQHMEVALGELALARGDPEVALERADHCLAAAASKRAIRNVVKAGRVRTRALRLLDREPEAEAQLARAVAAAEVYGNPAQLWRTYELAGRHADALRVMRAIARQLSAERRATLLASAQVARLQVDAQNRVRRST